jgi:hypothetical protein
MYSYNKNFTFDSVKNHESQLSFDHSLYSDYQYANSFISPGYTINTSTYNYDNNYKNNNHTNETYFFPSSNDSCIETNHYKYYNSYGQYSTDYYYTTNDNNMLSSNSNYLNTVLTNTSKSKSDATNSSNFITSESSSFIKDSSIDHIANYGECFDKSLVNADPKNSTPIYQDDLSPQYNTIQHDEYKLKPRNILNQLDEICTNVDKGHKRSYRTPFNTKQRYYLLKIFETTFYPSRDVLEEAAIHLNVTIKTLQTWFKNTRSKQKKVKNINKL